MHRPYIYRLRAAWLVFVLAPIQVLDSGCAKSKPAAGSGFALTIYECGGRGVEYSDEEIASMRKYVCDPNEIQVLLPQAMHRDGAPFWKGSRLGILKTPDGQVKRIAISFYGGFYTVSGERGYYVFSGAAREAWERLIERALLATPYIPPTTLPHGHGNQPRP